ncbi:MAG: divalent-cation tolerance protein CutA [Planctomycetes bacterium]|nr:divalent-cation tolerance protein CutA [Planctomycetota bacterium]
MAGESDHVRDVRVVLVTAPNREVAERIARELVGRRLAACVNVLDGVTSIYRWQGAVEEAREVLLVAKTTAARYADFERALHELHPYDVPECVALAPSAVAPKYLGWLVGETN